MSYYPGQAKTSQHILYTLMFTIGIGLTVGLYYVKIRAQSAKLEVARLERLVSEERVAVSVLRAEIAFLENPERISRLAQSELGLKPVGGDQIVTITDISTRVPFAKSQGSDGAASE